jgi:hypothetical protein
MHVSPGVHPLTHYLHYWAPLRAQLAFGDRRGTVASLDSGWFASLERDDVVWILSRKGEQLFLVLRGDVAANSRPVRTIPPYAVGNSPQMDHHRIRFDTRTASPPRCVPLSLHELKRLRFSGRSSRVNGPLRTILAGPLASLRRLDDAAVVILERAWNYREGHPWIDLDGPGLPPAVGLDVRPERAQRRIEVTVSRVVRDTLTVAKLKMLHGHRCQVCGKSLRLGRAKKYSEGHHLRPLGAPHDGPDVAANIVIVCPNHHALLDFAALGIAAGQLRSIPGHSVGQEFIRYHNRLVRNHLDPALGDD